MVDTRNMLILLNTIIVFTIRVFGWQILENLTCINHKI